jgi:large subunit ribosomal protein L18
MLTKSRKIRKKRIRGKISGTASQPRLSVFRSSKALYVQLIDDVGGATIASSSGADPVAVGEDIAKKAKGVKISQIVFDRSGYKYHGRVKLFGDSVRKGGIKF